MARSRAKDAVHDRSQQVQIDGIAPSGHQIEASNRHDLRVEYRSVSELKLRQSNPRTHSPRQVKQIAESIKAFGFTNPVLIDAEGTVIAGHGRVLAALRLGMDQVPTIRLEHLSDAEIRAYVITDNRLAEKAGWDRELLAIELQYLVELDIDLDVTITGFETAEIDLLIGELAKDGSGAEETIPEVDREAPPVTRAGDLWKLGRHLLLCGDARSGEAFAKLMGGKRAQMVFTDPPYNVPIDGHVCGLGAVKHREFAMASGEMSEAEFVGFLTAVLGHHAAHSANGSIHFVCMDWRHLGELLSAGRSTYGELKNLCVWTKTNAGMGSLYRSQHELVLVFKHGTGAHINNVELGRFGRYRTNVWSYAGANTFKAERGEELAMHPTVKPVALVADAILDCSKRGGIVLDGFAGSGTTLIAAERTGRIGYGLELDPAYVDVIVRRYQELTGQTAIHAVTGCSFDETRLDRIALAQEPGAEGEEKHD